MDLDADDVRMKALFCELGEKKKNNAVNWEKLRDPLLGPLLVSSSKVESNL